MRKINAPKGWYDATGKFASPLTDAKHDLRTGYVRLVSEADWRKLMAVRKAAHEVTRLDPKSSPLRATVDALERRNG